MDLEFIGINLSDNHPTTGFDYQASVVETSETKLVRPVLGTVGISEGGGCVTSA
jgi:hypothetical protein